MHVRCPHCHNPIEFAGEDLSDLTCPSCGSHFNLATIDTTATHHAAANRTIGHFELVEQVGVGHFGSVWKARDTQLDRIVAIKIPRRDQVDGAGVEVFFREARAAAQLRHPNIIAVHEVGRHEETIYIVSDFIEGANLKEWLSGQRFSPREAAQLMVKIATALEQAHQCGIVHRDLKPGNIMLDSTGEPHLADFGLAKRDSGEITMTMDGRILGTPAYMSPEQAQGKGHEADRRSDVYSLGVILYELLTGELPFRGETRMLVVQILNEEPPALRTLNARVPRDLETITLKCLEKDQAKRYQTAAALANDLQNWLDGQPIVARPIGRVARSWRWCKREPAIAGLAAAVALVLLAGISVSSWFAIAASISARDARDSATRAEQERRNAEQRAEAERAAKEQAAQALDQVARNEYVAQVRLVDRALADGDAINARAALESAPARYRGWEWDFAARELSQEILTIKGHTGTVTSVAFSPDGRCIVSGDTGGTLKLSDAASGDNDRTLAGHPRGLSCVAFSPDGRRLASGSYDNTIKLWEVETCKEIRALKGHKDAVSCVAFSPDGRRLASGSHDSTLKLWDAETGQEVTTLRGHANTFLVLSVAFSPDGRRLASGSHDSTVKLWDAGTGREIRTLKGHERGVSSVAFSPDGKRIVSASYDHTVKLWDAGSGRGISTLRGHTNVVLSVAFTLDGRRIASGGEDSTLKLWDAETGQEIRTFKGHRARVASMAFSPDGRRIVSGSEDSTVKLWDTGIDQRIGRFEGHSGVVSSVAISPDGRWIVSGSLDSTVKLWDAQTGQEIRTLEGHVRGVESVAFSSDGRRIVSGAGDSTIKLWDTNSGQEIRTLKGHTQGVHSVAFRPDGSFIVSGGRDGSLKLWDVEAGQESQTLNGHTGRVSSVMFNTDGRRIVSGSLDSTVKLWDAQTGQEIRTLKGHVRGVESVAFSSDGRRIVSGAGDSTIKLWDTNSGQEIRTLKGHTQGVSSVAFTPDGQRIVSGSWDGSLKLWDDKTGQEVRTLKAGTAEIKSVAISRDSQRIFSGADDNTITLWDAEPLNEQAQYAQVLAREALEEQLDSIRARRMIEGQTNLPGGLKRTVIDRLDRLSVPAVLTGMARRRAEAEVQREQWTAAVGHFQKAVELEGNSAEADLITRVALAALAAAEDGTYREACARLWDQEHESTNERTFLEAVTICSAGPDALADMGPLVDAFEARRGRNVGYHLLVPSLVIHYRAHLFEQAIKLQQIAEMGYFVVKRTPSFAGVEWLRVPQALFAAMAYQQLGKADEAKKYLKIGQQAHDELMVRQKDAAATSGSVLSVNSWQCRVMLAHNRREAESLINGAEEGTPAEDAPAQSEPR